MRAAKTHYLHLMHTPHTRRTHVSVRRERMPTEEEKTVNEEEESEEEEEEEEEESEEDEESGEEEDEESDSAYDDPPDYVDNVTDEELLGDLLKQKPKVEEGVDNIIVVDNAPKVGPDRMQKLQNVLEKIFGRFGTIVRRYYPVDEATQMFKGYFFLEFSTRKGAETAVATGNGYRLDKTHVFAINFFSDFDKYRNLPGKWEVRQKREFEDTGNLRSWLLNKSCFDQFSVIYGTGETAHVAICENNGKEPKLVKERKNWTDTYVRWSPRGTYLATFHRQGVALWGGPEFERLARFSHNGVQLIDFSPCERYMVTFGDIVDGPDSPQSIIVWEIRTGKKKRSFQRGNAEDWPILKWNKDGEYFARMSDSLIGVYQTPSFGLLDKKSILVKEVKDLSWCPTVNHLAYWVPETSDIPAKITVMEIPSRNILSTKSKMLVKECKLHWHKGGDYLCVKVDHYLTKTKKQLCSSFEIFHMREPQIPVDTLEMKEPVLAFALEPTGSKFVIIHGEPPIRVSASFYKINDKGAAITKLKTLERREVNHILWCPTGQFVVLAGMKGPINGTLEFIDTADIAMSNVVEHGGLTDVEWDPTGRYVTSAVSYWSQKMDTAFIVWSFQGNVLYRNPVQMDKFCQLLWRPRPPSLLSKDDLQTTKKEMKKYQMMFEQEDRSIRSKASKELLEKRTKLMKEYSEYRKRREDLMRDRKSIFLEGIPPAEEESYEEQVSSVLISETVEPV